MKRFLVLLAIAVSAALAVAPVTAESASIRLPNSPATLAMSPVDFHQVHLTNVTVNGGAITGPVAPGSSVQVEFDWSLSEVAGCPGCVIQFYVGFQGTPATCVESGFAGESGDGSVTLTAPTKLGNQLILVNVSYQFDCVETTSGINDPTTNNRAGILGVVVIKK